MTKAQKETHWSGWVATALGIMWLALFPLWQDGSFTRITHSKWMGMLVLTAVTAAAGIRMIAGLVRRGEYRQQVRLGAVHALALAYFLLVAASAIFGTWADYLNESNQLTVLWGAKRYEGLYTQLCYAAVFLCMSLQAVRIDRVLDAAGDTLLLFCVIVCLQYFGINVLGLFPEGRSIRTNYEFQGTIGNIDMVSGYVSIVMSALLGGFVKLRQGSWLWLVSGLAGILLMLCIEVQSGLIVVAMLLFCLLLLALHDPLARWRTMLVLGGSLLLVTARLLTGLPWLDGVDALTFPHAPAAWKLLPALFGLACIAGAALLHRYPGRAMRLRFVALTACLLLLAVLAAAYLAPLPTGSGAWEIQELLHGRPQDAYGSERIGIWRLTLEMSRSSLLFGTGPDTFLYAMEDHMFQTGQSLAQRFDNPHNMLLSILSNNGLPALLAFVLLCGWAVISGLRRCWQDGLLVPMLLGCGCYLAQGMFTFSICLVTPMFWAALGMLTAQVYDRKEEMCP
ncbi:MAG: O-antigen ligase family protein [Clostridia bacterium]|nr:O-antigen ligase family protein [Clostridia bacterium]